MSLLSLLALAALRRSPMSGPNATALKQWIATHMPELDAEFGPMPLYEVRVRLNAITGCTVGGGEPVEQSCAVFLAALQAQHLGAEKEAS